MLTIGKLARRFGLSRGTLLHYDAIGLLRPSGRSGAGYRLYTAADVARMERLCLYREAGLPLERIRALLDAPDGAAVAILENQLRALAGRLSALRRQQRVLLDLLGADAVRKAPEIVTKERWTELLAAAGLDEDGMWRWHAEFERRAPTAHADFLLSLGLGKAEVERIRTTARERAVSSASTE